jgi:hypothetical protein
MSLDVSLLWKTTLSEGEMELDYPSCALPCFFAWILPVLTQVLFPPMPVEGASVLPLSE